MPTQHRMTTAPQTADPTTADPTTADPTTAGPTTADPTTADRATAHPTPADPTTADPTPADPTTAGPTTARPITAGPTTAGPTTADPTTADPTTADRATAHPTTADRATADLATAHPTTADRATADLATAERATAERATADLATADPITADPTPVTPPPAASAGPTQATPPPAASAGPTQVTPPPAASAAPNPTPAPTPAEIEAADRRAREWHSPTEGELPIGSDRHRDAACQMFHATFNPYKPSVIAWPRLDPDALARLTSLPIWDIAVTTETKARARMLAYGETIDDPAWRDAISRNGWEEGRHKEVLSNLVASYGIALVPEPPDKLPADPEWGYLVTGYSECIDSFFAFGLFEVARRSGYFPKPLVDTFEPVIQEEARHILLFANWLAWHRKRLPPLRRLRFEARVIRAWIFLAWERIGLARDLDNGDKPAVDNNFTLNGSKAVSDIDLKPLDLMAICLTENDRRFAGYDRRLLRPTTTPALAALAVRIGRLFRRRATLQAIDPT